MNNKAQMTLLNIGIGIFIIILAFTFMTPMKKVTEQIRGTDQLDCTNSSISDGAKATCLATDIILPYFIVVILGLGFAIITAKWIGG